MIYTAGTLLTPYKPPAMRWTCPQCQSQTEINGEATIQEVANSDLTCDGCKAVFEVQSITFGGASIAIELKAKEPTNGL